MSEIYLSHELEGCEAQQVASERVPSTLSGIIGSLSLEESSLLSPEEEVLLSDRIQAGIIIQEKYNQGEVTDEADAAILDDAREAENAFILSNLPLVISRAHRFPYVDGDELFALIADGSAILRQYVREFDPSRGKFSTRTVPRIDEEMRRGRDKRLNNLYVPLDPMTKFWAAVKRGEDTGTSMPEVSRAKQALSPIDTPLHRDEGLTIGDTIEAENDLFSHDELELYLSMIDLINQAELNEQEKAVIVSSFSLETRRPETPGAVLVSKEIDLKTADVKILLASALEKLRKTAEALGLDEDLLSKAA